MKLPCTRPAGTRLRAFSVRRCGDHTTHQWSVNYSHQQRAVAGTTDLLRQQFRKVQRHIRIEYGIFPGAPAGQKGTASAQLMSPTMLGTTLSASAGQTDGVDFTVSGDAALCLRDTGSSGVNIYLGETLDDAIAVTAPVALTSADACGDVTAATDAAPLYGRKFHPGHYIALMRNASSQQIMAQSMKPGVVGFVKRYTWRELEPSKGQYNFAGVKSDLAWAQAHGMRIIFMIEDRTFTLEKAGPQYLDKYEQRTRSGG